MILMYLMVIYLKKYLLFPGEWINRLFLLYTLATYVENKGDVWMQTIKSAVWPWGDLYSFYKQNLATLEI